MTSNLQGPPNLIARWLLAQGALIAFFSACIAGAPPAVSSLPLRPVAQADPGACEVASVLAPVSDEVPEPLDVYVTVLSKLVERLEGAERAMQMVSDASEIETALCGARLTLEVLAGPRGRHANGTVLFPGVLPGDTPVLVDPGLALTAHDTASDERIREAMAQGILGDIGRWRQPSQRWDEIDRAVAGWTPGDNPLLTLDGRVMRLIALARLTPNAPSVEVANQLGRRGAQDASASLQAAREALAVLCESREDPRCEYGR